MMISTKRLLFIILLVVTCAQSYAEDFSFSTLTNIFGKYYVKKRILRFLTRCWRMQYIRPLQINVLILS